MKKVLIIFGCFLAVFLIIGLSIFIYFSTLEVPEVEINEVDLNTIEDGVYTGEYELKPVRVVVKVTVSNHKISNIIIVEHENALGSKAEEIVDDIITLQVIDVEVVSGATFSSNTIKKAVEQALINPSKVE